MSPRIRTVSHASFAARAVEDDVRLELESHIELCAADLVEAGATPEAARAEAMRRFGDIERVSRDCLALKLPGTQAMKTIAATLVVTVLVVTFALMFTTVQMRREAARSEAMAMEARHMAAVAQRAQDPILLGADGIAEPGDTIVVLGTGGMNEIDLRARVDQGGTVLLPELEHVLVTDKTRAELQAWLSAAYERYYAQPGSVVISIERRH